ncbi:flagellar basal-body MS-ring/collar protein FliF, partial [Paracoccus ravus]|uniref:flagellar basal-body MS-ring/collar protein FliF n=1 Tax=Paracoccus ravus TaxID=2447760 RepID=UPI00106E8DBE
MQVLQHYWTARTIGQRALIFAIVPLVLLATATATVLAGRPSMALLYSGLETRQAAAVLTAVESSGVPYRIKGNSIWVDEKSRDKLRLALAGEGLPSQGGPGYELLDNMSGFGTTSQMFDAAYWRAKEGELARTALAFPNVESARVHISASSGRGYSQKKEPRASVTLVTRSEPIDQAQAKALKFLVSSAVPGLSPELVSVIDGDRGVVAESDGRSSQELTQEMKSRVERLLEAHVGPGNALVEINLDFVNETELLTEQRFDPEQRVLVSQETQDLADKSSGGESEPVTAASNLPEQTDNLGSPQTSSRSESRQRSNFEVSKMTREVTKQPGSRQRLTVAVLVNNVVKTQEDGTQIFEPRPEVELNNLRELVQSALGYNEARGDVVTVKSLLFASPSQSGSADAQHQFIESGLNNRFRRAPRHPDGFLHPRWPSRPVPGLETKTPGDGRGS